MHSGRRDRLPTPLLAVGPKHASALVRWTVNFLVNSSFHPADSKYYVQVIVKFTVQQSDTAQDTAAVLLSCQSSIYLASSPPVCDLLVAAGLLGGTGITPPTVAWAEGQSRLTMTRLSATTGSFRRLS